jgi:hypothetical protein
MQVRPMRHLRVTLAFGAEASERQAGRQHDWRVGDVAAVEQRSQPAVHNRSRHGAAMASRIAGLNAATYNSDLVAEIP